MPVQLDRMTPHPPFEIGPRLLPAIRCKDAWIYCEALSRDHEGRTVYRWTVDLPGRKRAIRGTDLKSGIDGGTVQEGFGSLLAFLSAFGDSLYWDSRRRPHESKRENSSLFPRSLADFAQEHYEALSSIGMEIEEPANRNRLITTAR